MRNFTFQRTSTTKPAPEPREPETKVERPELVDASDIPAFLRRERRDE